MAKKITSRNVISWSLQVLMILVACLAVWLYVSREHNIQDENRYHALSGALSQVGVAYWERDISTGEYRFGENFSRFLGLTSYPRLSPTWFGLGSMLEIIRYHHPKTVEDWLNAVHPDDREELSRLLDIKEGSFSGSFRIRNNAEGDGWRQILVSGVAHGPLLVGVCAAFPEQSPHPKKQELNRKEQGGSQ